MLGTLARNHTTSCGRPPNPQQRHLTSCPSRQRDFPPVPRSARVEPATLEALRSENGHGGIRPLAENGVQVPPDIPAYVFIKRELKNQIESGELAEGDR